MSAREALEAFQKSGRDIPGPSWFDHEHPLWREIDPDAAHALGLWISGRPGVLPSALMASTEMLVKVIGEDRMVQVYRLDGQHDAGGALWRVVLDEEGRPICSGPEVDRPPLRAV